MDKSIENLLSLPNHQLWFVIITPVAILLFCALFGSVKTGTNFRFNKFLFCSKQEKEGFIFIVTTSYSWCKNFFGIPRTKLLLRLDIGLLALSGSILIFSMFFFAVSFLSGLVTFFLAELFSWALELCGYMFHISPMTLVISAVLNFYVLLTILFTDTIDVVKAERDTLAIALERTEILLSSSHPNSEAGSLKSEFNTILKSVEAEVRSGSQIPYKL